MKSAFLLVAAVLSCGILTAQAEPGVKDLTQFLDENKPIAEYAGKKTARSMIREFFAAPGRPQQGYNLTKGAFVAVGYGDISVSSDSSDFMVQRLYAFEKAMLDAKASTASFLETTISVAAERKVFKSSKKQGTTPAELATQAAVEAPKTSLIGKGVALVEAKIDAALRANGVNPNATNSATDAARTRAQEILNNLKNSDEFKQTVKQMAASMVSGIQALYTVETEKTIAVVTVWSPKLSAVADSLVHGTKMLTSKGKTRIVDQIDKDPMKLLSTFGVQQKIDENGNLVLVSFAQGEAEDEEDSLDVEIAYDTAETMGTTYIRQFAGEAVTTGRELDNAYVKLSFRDGRAPDFSNQSTYANYQKTVSEAMAINGIYTIYEWEAVHPLTGRMVFGVIRAWSPAVAEMARDVKTQMEKSARDGAVGQRTISGQNGLRGTPSGSGTSGSRGRTAPNAHFNNAGAIADPDAY